MFESFNEKSLRVIMLSQDEVRRQGFSYIEIEHLFIGILEEETNIGSKTLKKYGFKTDFVKNEVERELGRGGNANPIEIPFSLNTRKVLELAWDEARQLGHNYIGPEHFLLGIIKKYPLSIVRIFEKMNLNINEIANEIKQILSSRNKKINTHQL